MAKHDLKPCPFCGRHGVLQKQVWHYSGEPKDHFGVHCANTHCCGGRLGYHWLTKGGAIRAWNRRKA